MYKISRFLNTAKSMDEWLKGIKSIGDVVVQYKSIGRWLSETQGVDIDFSDEKFMSKVLKRIDQAKGWGDWDRTVKQNHFLQTPMIAKLYKKYRR